METLTASRPGKVSKHVITNLVFENIDVVRNVFAMVMDKMGPGEEAQNMFDGMVYYAGRIFRTAFSFKIGATKFPLVPESANPLTVDTFTRYLVTHPPANAVFIPGTFHAPTANPFRECTGEEVAGWTRAELAVVAGEIIPALLMECYGVKCARSYKARQVAPLRCVLSLIAYGLVCQIKRTQHEHNNTRLSVLLPIAPVHRRKEFSYAAWQPWMEFQCMDKQDCGLHATWSPLPVFVTSVKDALDEEFNVE